MAASDIPSEVCAMETCEGEQTDGLSSDIGGFLSGSCMENDVKSDPFNSDNTLGFSEDSSRFDSECMLSSSLTEGVPVQQTTCESTVASYISGEGISVGSASVLTGGSLFLCDSMPPNSSVQKPTNPVMQFSSPSVLLVSGADSKSCVGTDHNQKLDMLSPVQLFTPAVSQSHPVVIGNSTAASFVKSVMKDAAPHTSSSTFTPPKDTVGAMAPGFVLLNSSVLPPLSLIPSSAGISASPLLLQLPPGIISSGQELQLSAYSLGSQSSTADIMPVSSVSAHSADSIKSECSMADGSNSNSIDVPHTSDVSSPSLSSTASSVVSSASLCPTSSNAGRETNFSSAIIYSNNNNSDTVTSSANSSAGNTLQTPEKAAARHVVLSCSRPNKADKGMQQILEHFLQQNSKLNTTPVTNDRSENVPASVSADLNAGTVSGSLPPNTAQPQVISVADINSSTLTVPSLGTKSSSIVLILKRKPSQTNEQCQNNSSPAFSPVDINSADLNRTTQTNDEIDGSVPKAGNPDLTLDNPASAVVLASNNPPSSSGACVSSEQTGVLTSKASSDIQMASSVSDSDPNKQFDFQWMQIQLPDSSAKEEQSAGSSDGDNIQKLVPLTVNEKLLTDTHRPIIICIIQEDGVMKKVNINPGEVNQDKEKKDKESTVPQKPDCASSDTASKQDTLAMGDNSTSDSTDADVTQMETDSQVSQHIPQSVPVTAGPSQSSQESKKTSSQTAHDGETSHSQTVSKKSPEAGKNKPFKCDLCTAVFSRLGNYTRHRKIHTLNLKEDKQHKCPYCDRLFLQRCDMNRHIVIHTNQHPFRCKICGNGYIRKSDLVVHERFHTKDRAFKCETCGRSFFQSGDLNRHKRFVHSEQAQLSCGHCQRKYANEVTLIRHMKTAHNDILMQSMSQNTQQQ